MKSHDLNACQNQGIKRVHSGSLHCIRNNWVNWICLSQKGLLQLLPSTAFQQYYYIWNCTKIGGESRQALIGEGWWMCLCPPTKVTISVGLMDGPAVFLTRINIAKGWQPRKLGIPCVVSQAWYFIREPEDSRPLGPSNLEGQFHPCSKTLSPYWHPSILCTKTLAHSISSLSWTISRSQAGNNGCKEQSVLTLGQLWMLQVIQIHCFPQETRRQYPELKGWKWCVWRWEKTQKAQADIILVVEGGMDNRQEWGAPLQWLPKWLLKRVWFI